MRRAARVLFRSFVPRGKIAISFLIFLLVWPMFIPLLVSGQESQQAAPPLVQSTQYAPDVPKDENSNMQVRLINVLSAISCQIAGVNPAYPNRPCVTINNVTEKVSFLPQPSQQSPQVGGAIGFMNTMINGMYEVPVASTHDYVAYLDNNFGIAKKTYAQGAGFSSLSPVLPLWTASRNVAYFFYILAFVVVGILVMIRVRIDPRTVMTIQNQIPKIVVGIILITFSYAIVGFLVDLMYTSMYVVTNIITSVKVPIYGEQGKFHDYTKIGPGVMSATNPFVAANRMADTDEFITVDLPDANDTPGPGVPVVDAPDDITLHSGIATLAEGPASEVGEAIGGVFDGWIGGQAKGMLLGLLGAMAGRQIASAAGGGGAAKLALTLGLGALTIFAPQIGIPAGALLPVFAATPFIAGATKALRGGSKTALVGNTVGAILTGLITANAIDKATASSKSVAQGLFTFIAFIIIAVAILSSLFRLWFALMKCYLLILINTIFAPFYILFGLFPGSAMTFGNWLRGMLGNLAAFPVVIGFFLIGRVVMDGMGTTQSQGIFVPPLVANGSIAGTIQSIVGFTFILMAPGVVGITRSIFQAKASEHTSAIGPGIAAGVGYTVGMLKNPLTIMSQADEARLNPDTQRYEKTGHARAIFRRLVG